MPPSPRPRRPRGQPALAHDWRWAPQARRLPWGYLEATGPREQSYVVGRGTVDGDGYECARCGCVRLHTWLTYVDDEGDSRQRSVAMYGFDWDSLAPMSAPSCEAWEWPLPDDALTAAGEVCDDL